MVVRCFARHALAEDPRHEVPPARFFGPPSPRPVPHIFSAEEIHRLLTAAAMLSPRGSLRPLTYVTLFSLLVATGLRISEALALRIDDITPPALWIRRTKFKKSRLVPLHDSARRGLDRYLARRKRIAGTEAALFVDLRGKPLTYRTVDGTFLTLARSTGLRPGPGSPGARIHDLRHTFAVRSLEACARDTDAVAHHVLALSTYLGHARFEDTYRYLHATPQLLRGIADASEALAQGGSS
jgi:integrase